MEQESLPGASATPTHQPMEEGNASGALATRQRQPIRAMKIAPGVTEFSEFSGPETLHSSDLAALAIDFRYEFVDEDRLGNFTLVVLQAYLDAVAVFDTPRESGSTISEITTSDTKTIHRLVLGLSQLRLKDRYRTVVFYPDLVVSRHELDGRTSYKLTIQNSPQSKGVSPVLYTIASYLAILHNAGMYTPIKYIKGPDRLPLLVISNGLGQEEMQSGVMNTTNMFVLQPALSEVDPVELKTVICPRSQMSRLSYTVLANPPAIDSLKCIPDCEQTTGDLILDGTCAQSPRWCVSAFRRLRFKYRERYIFFVRHWYDCDLQLHDVFLDAADCWGLWTDPVTTVEVTREQSRETSHSIDMGLFNWLFMEIWRPFKFRRQVNISPSSQEIRLLSIPPKGSAEALAHEYQFEYMRLDDEQFPFCKYPLLYPRKWIGTLRNEKIFVEGHPFAVTEKELGALQSTQSEHEQSYAWIRSICINLQDKAEVEHHDRLHPQIYERMNHCSLHMDLHDWTAMIQDDNRQFGFTYRKLQHSKEEFRLIHPYPNYQGGNYANSAALSPCTPNPPRHPGPSSFRNLMSRGGPFGDSPEHGNLEEGGVCPWTTANDATLPLQMFIANMSSPPSYVALSYVWAGDGPNMIATIQNNQSQNLGVGESRQEYQTILLHNLGAALVRFADIFPGELLWADSICIDQTDLEERSDQVSIMTDIYKNASKVMAWMGPQGDGSDDVIAFLKEIGGLKYDAGSPSLSILQNMEFSQRIVKFMHRNWWHRLWIFQEAINAKSLLLVCGNSSIEFEDLHRAIRMAIYYSNTVNEDLCLPSFSELELIHYHRQSRLHTRTGFRRGEEFLFYILILSQRRYTDPKDIIFSAFGLARTELSFVPDYSQDILSIYVGSTFAIVATSGKLDVLQYAGFLALRHALYSPSFISIHRSTKMGTAMAKNQVYWPTWVPDWRENQKAEASCQSWARSQSWHQRDQHFPTLRSAADTLANPSMEEDNTVIVLNGYVVGAVDHLYSVDNFLNIEEGFFSVLERESLMQRKLEVPTQHRDLLLACVDICLDHIRKEGLHGDEMNDCTWWDLFISSLIAVSTRNTDDTQVGNMPLSEFQCTSTKIQENERQDAHGVVRRILDAWEWLITVVLGDRTWLVDKSFACFTSESGFGGGCCLPIAKGDIVVILQGGGLPFVLRKRDDGKYFLIGPAYVGSLVDGSFMRQKQEDNVTMETFRLV